MRFAPIFFAAFLLMLGMPHKAHADDFAAADAALLDPFDPVPQIRFSDCYDDCGYRRRCWDGCGYRRHCWDRCGDWRERWGDGWRCDRDCYDYEHIGWHCERDCGPDPTTFGRAWFARLHEYDRQVGHWRGDMMEWHDAMGEWYEENGHWLFRHYADYEWRHDGDRWRYWHGGRWLDDGVEGHWHDGHP